MRRTRTVGALAAVAALAALGAGAGGAGLRAGSPPQNAAPPTISGTARQGQTLSASSGSWGGTAPISYSYRWQRCNANGASCFQIPGATGTTYVLTPGDVGRTIRVAVTASNSAGTAAALSAPAGPVASLGQAPAATKQPDPIGTAQEGNTIRVDNGSWSGTQPITFAYQWQRCTATNPVCSDVAGATSQSYAVVTADVGSRLRARVTASNAAGTGSVYSNLTATVQRKGTPPVNTALPVVIGTPAVGQMVASSPGQWSGANPSSFSYQWSRCDRSGNGCADIAGSTGTTYTVQSADTGQSLRVRVGAKNAYGSTAATSAAVAVSAGSGGSGQIPIGGGLVSVPIDSLAPHPDHLIISGVSFSPSPFRSPGGTFTARFRVFNEGTNQVVRGALVYVVAIPYAWAHQAPEAQTGTDGWATIQIATTSKLPHSGALVMQVRARAPGTTASDILGGVSTRRLVQLSLR